MTPSDVNERSVSGGCLNVFEALGLPDADELQFKSDLVARLQAVIDGRHLSTEAAGNLFGLSVVELNYLLVGHFGGYSTEQLFRMLNCMGQTIQITIHNTASQEEARVLVA